MASYNSLMQSMRSAISATLRSSEFAMPETPDRGPQGSGGSGNHATGIVVPPVVKPILLLNAVVSYYILLLPLCNRGCCCFFRTVVTLFRKSYFYNGFGIARYGCRLLL